MTRVLALIIFLPAFFVSFAQADIYVWTDENGIKHFTNYSPPPEAEVMLKSEEPSADAFTEQEFYPAEAAQDLIRINQEIADKQLIIAMQQEEAEERIAEANRQAEQVLQQAEALLQEAQETAEYVQDYPTYRYGYGYAYSYRNRCNRYGYLKYGSCYPAYYRKDGGIYYYKKRHDKHRRYRGDHHRDREHDHFRRHDRNRPRDDRQIQRPSRRTQQANFRNRQLSSGRNFGRSGGGSRSFAGSGRGGRRF